MKAKKWIPRILVVAVLISLLVPMVPLNSIAAPPLPGAIFTTLHDGSAVNKNIYQKKEDVYLDGGPGPNAPAGAAGLPEGDYYFQVTDPSGKDLLSTDHISCRMIHVNAAGVISFVYSGTNYEWSNKDKAWLPIYNFKHNEGIDLDHFEEGAITVQLMPYDDTPNPGGVYKVWITPVADYAGDPDFVPTARKDAVNGENWQPANCHGFIPCKSKTDNYKVKVKGKQPDTPEIKIFKFEDLNGNGLWENNEPAMEGWGVTITPPLGSPMKKFTDSNGLIQIWAENGQWTIEEDLPGDWAVTATIIDGQPATNPEKTVILNVDTSISTSYTVAFGNFKHCGAIGHKYNDLDGDGVHDAGEPGIEGWIIYMYRYDGTEWYLYDTTTTNDTGYYYFEISIGGKFKVVEYDDTGWDITGDPYFEFDGISGTDVGPFDFLNFELLDLSGYKYEDMIGDGDWDAGDSGLPGWTITLYKDGVYHDETTTDASGYYEFTDLGPGDYEVKETMQSGWYATGPTSFKFNGVSGEDKTYDFFNFKLGKISGHKWYDANGNGVKDSTEQYTDGVEIQLWKDGVKIDWTYTANGGYYEFTDLYPGEYVIKEVLPANGVDYIWVQTYPGNNWNFKPLLSGTELTDADFGNVKEYPYGHTWGYWKTHTSYGPAGRDDTYDKLPSNPMYLDLTTPDNDNNWVENDYEADWVFNNCGMDGPPSGSGNGVTLFRCKLLALHMTLLLYPGMGDAVYYYPGDSNSGMTVDEIYDAAIDMLYYGASDYHDMLNTLDKINNNGNYGPGNHVLYWPTP
jgi:hypothetical protein